MSQEVEGGKGSQAISGEFWIGRTRVLEVPGELPPRWIKNAQKSRKRIEPEIVDALRSVKEHSEKSPERACGPKKR